ncbi:MAG: nuclear transport factor 2 family protein [Gemmatimonadaceae bacterium]
MNVVTSTIARACLVAVLIAPAIVDAQQSTAPTDERAVRDVVGAYLYGLKFNTVDSLKLAFWPDAKLYFVKRDGSLGQLSQEQWYKGFTAPVGTPEEGELRITAVSLTRDIATVTVVEDYAKSRYTDYLSLVRWGGVWRIVNKVYTAEPR